MSFIKELGNTPTKQYDSDFGKESGNCVSVNKEESLRKKIWRVCKCVFYELKSALFLLAVYPLPMLKGRRQWSKPPEGQNHGHILLLHGLFHNSSAWTKDFVNSLVDKGFHVHVLDLKNTTNSQDGIKGLALQVDKYIKDNNLEGRISLIGHSEGGLVAAKYVEEIAPEGSINKVITIGSPWKGSSWANAFSFLGSCVREMRTDSEPLGKLWEKVNRKENKTSYHFMGCRGDMLVPFSRSYPGEDPLGENPREEVVELDVEGGHAHLLLSPKTKEQIHKIL